MTTCGHVFQMIVALPNMLRDPGVDLGIHIGKLLREMQAMRLREPGRRAEFVLKGREEYLDLLGRRARHHRIPLQRFMLAYGGKSVLQPTVRVQQAVRDFYHHAYYAAFFVARYGMVSAGGFDCSVHAKLPKFIVPVVEEFDSSKSVLARKTQRILEELQPRRDNADYVMRIDRIEELAQPQTIRQSNTDVETLFADWGVS